MTRARNDESVSRRRLLRTAGTTAAGAIATGFFLRDAPTATATAATHFDEIDVDRLTGHIVEVSNSWVGLAAGKPFFLVTNLATTGSVPAIQGQTNSHDGVGVYGAGWNGGTGVSGVGRVGVFGISSEDGWFGIWGRHTGNSPGVAGDSGSGPGIVGNSTNGYGAQFDGGKAQLRLVPKATAGKPTSGAHTKGEIYMDSKGAIFVCVAAGTPGKWRKISTTLA